MIAQFPNVLQYKNTPIATQLSYLIPVHSPHLNIKFVLFLILESRRAKLLESTKRSWRGRNTSGGRGSSRNPRGRRRDSWPTGGRGRGRRCTPWSGGRGRGRRRGTTRSRGRGRGRYSIWLSRSYCGSSDKLNM